LLWLHEKLSAATHLAAKRMAGALQIVHDADFTT
jgi:hypothetical protein